MFTALSVPVQTLPGEGTFAERLATTCANASAELTHRGELHGYVINSVRNAQLSKF